MSIKSIKSSKTAKNARLNTFNLPTVVSNLSIIPIGTVSFTSVPTSIDEGSIANISILTSGLADSKILYWTVNNISTTNADFIASNGTVNAIFGSGTFAITPSLYYLEGTETFRIDIRSSSVTGNILVTSNIISINDTSTIDPPVVEYLVVAGGGGGGNYGGGGGAGGVKRAASYPVNPYTPYTITVGGGGLGGLGFPAIQSGTNGSDSQFTPAIVSTGGGGGGKYLTAGNPGGSGGGGGMATASPGIVPVGLASPAGQGNNGGAGRYNPSAQVGGGGGGAGFYGEDGPTAAEVRGGAGGYGIISFINGSNLYYAGGGGGVAVSGGGGVQSAGGAGGGAAGYTGPGSGYAANGLVNTGGGGGGGGAAAFAASTGNGGSGVVVIRHSNVYALATTTGSPNVIYSNANIIYQFWQSGTIIFN